MDQNSKFRIKQIISQITSYIGLAFFILGFVGTGIFVIVAGFSAGISEGSIEIIIVLTIFGLIFLGVGVGFSIPIYKHISGKYIAKTGRIIYAKISKIEFLPNVYINGVNPGYIHAVYIDGANAAFFKSKNLERDMSDIYKVGDQIKIFVMDRKCKHYEFDYEEIENKINFKDLEINMNFNNLNLGETTEVSTPNMERNVIQQDYNKVFENMQGGNFGAYNKIKQEEQENANWNNTNNDLYNNQNGQEN